MHLNDTSAITSRRTQGPLQNQAHATRRQGLQTGQDIIIQSLGKGLAAQGGNPAHGRSGVS
ncbi:hypothetical protein AAV94_05975 [Lampropedia cohaerens]|uniref:Uncharacterized protein n=1 Tax=Lampropedia cohaerens TaxID=1610491 RepID=A0A0U1Q0P9_9BURK|nr:hypothetical protein AAV94_05975 [Lampropedia cohaerens]